MFIYKSFLLGITTKVQNELIEYKVSIIIYLHVNKSGTLCILFVDGLELYEYNVEVPPTLRKFFQGQAPSITRESKTTGDFSSFFSKI